MLGSRRQPWKALGGRGQAGTRATASNSHKRGRRLLTDEFARDDVLAEGGALRRRAQGAAALQMGAARGLSAPILTAARRRRCCERPRGKYQVGGHAARPPQGSLGRCPAPMDVPAAPLEAPCRESRPPGRRGPTGVGGLAVLCGRRLRAPNCRCYGTGMRTGASSNESPADCPVPLWQSCGSRALVAFLVAAVDGCPVVSLVIEGAKEC